MSKLYSVGGCVRDKLLGIQPKDYDYVYVAENIDKIDDLKQYRDNTDFDNSDE